MSQDHDLSTHEPNSANAAWSAGSIRPTSSNISLCSLLKKFEYLSYYWAYLMIKMMMMMMIMMMMIMMTMVFFLGMVDWRKTLSFFFQPEWLLQGSQHRKPATHHEKDFPLSRTWVYVLLNEVVSSDNRHTNFSNKKAASKYFLFHLEK